MTRTSTLATILCVLLSGASGLQAQAPSAERPTLTVGALGGALLSTGPGDLAPPDLYGMGGRFAVNMAGFTGPTVHFLDYVSLGGFYFSFPEQAEEMMSATYFGAELDLFLMRRAIGGVLDPFLSAAVGSLEMSSPVAEQDGRLVVSPGLGFRIPLASRLELRLDGQYLTVFAPDDATAAAADADDENFFQFSGGVQLGF